MENGREHKARARGAARWPWGRGSGRTDSSDVQPKRAAAVWCLCSPPCVSSGHQRWPQISCIFPQVRFCPAQCYLAHTPPLPLPWSICSVELSGWAGWERRGCCERAQLSYRAVSVKPLGRMLWFLACFGKFWKVLRLELWDIWGDKSFGHCGWSLGTLGPRGVCEASGSCASQRLALLTPGLKNFKPLGFINFCQKLSVTSINYGEKLTPRKPPSLPKPWAPSDPGRAVQPARAGDGSCSRERGDLSRVTFRPFRYFINALSWGAVI